MVICLHPKYKYISEAPARVTLFNVTAQGSLQFPISRSQLAYWCIPSIFINVVTLNDWVNSEWMFYHISTNGANQCTCIATVMWYHMPIAMLAYILRLTKKMSLLLCLYQLWCICKCIGIKIFLLYIAKIPITNKAVSMMMKMNTLNFLLVKIFPTLIHQIFHHQNFVPYSICTGLILSDFNVIL